MLRHSLILAALFLTASCAMLTPPGACPPFPPAPVDLSITPPEFLSLVSKPSIRKTPELPESGAAKPSAGENGTSTVKATTTSSMDGLRNKLREFLKK